MEQSTLNESRHLTLRERRLTLDLAPYKVTHRIHVRVPALSGFFEVEHGVDVWRVVWLKHPEMWRLSSGNLCKPGVAQKNVLRWLRVFFTEDYAFIRGCLHSPRLIDEFEEDLRKHHEKTGVT